MLQSPLFQGLMGQATGLVQNPLSMGPDVVAKMMASALGQAQGSYDSALRNTWERAGASGGYRSGLTRGQEMRAAQGLGEQSGNIVREIETRAAMQRPADIINALSAAIPALATQFQFDRDIANVYAGGATNPVWSQPSPLQTGLQGAGQLGMNVVGLEALTGGPGGSGGIFK